MNTCAMIVWFMVGTHEPAAIDENPPVKTVLAIAEAIVERNYGDPGWMPWQYARGKVYPVIQPCKD